jgi:hypothetical protein
MNAPLVNPVTGEILEGIQDHIDVQIERWPKVISGLEPLKELELRGKLAAKLAQAYQRISAVIHDDRNTEHKYSFASAETIYKTCRNGMAEVGLAIIPFMDSYIEAPIFKTTPSGEQGDRRGAYMLVNFDYCLIDSETGYTVVIPWRGEVMEYGDKAFNKASTNATKYMLRTLFLLPTDRDDDPDRSSEEGRPLTQNRGRGQNRGEQQNRQSASEAQKESEFIAMYKAANAKIKELKLDEDRDGLRSFSEKARAANLDPLALFRKFSSDKGDLRTWNEFHLVLDEYIAANAANESLGKSQPKSEGDDGSLSSTEESKTSNEPDGKTNLPSSDESEKTDTVEGSQPKTSSVSSSPNPESVIRLKKALERSPDKDMVLNRAKSLGISVDDLIAEAVSRNEKAAMPHLLAIIEEFEPKGR